MGFSRYKLHVFIQLILIAATCVAFSWTIRQDHMVLTNFTIVAIWIIQLAYLFYYLQKSQRQLIRFLEAFKNQDSSVYFNEHIKDKNFSKLYHVFNQIIKEFRLVRAEKELQHQFLQRIIEHVPVGLLAFDEKGNTRLCNNFLLKTLSLKQIKNIADVKSIKANLPLILKRIKPMQTEMVKLKVENQFLHLSLKASLLKIQDKSIKLVSFQDIKTEIETNEIVSWQKLIRILTHEIMNSVSPVTLLSSSMIKTFQENTKPLPASKIKKEDVERLLLGLQTIRKRSKGLTRFVENYRSVTKISTPKFTDFYVKDLVQQIEVLFREDLRNKQISFSQHILPENLKITADEKLIEQVLINLIKNAIESTENIQKPIIEINAYKENENVRIDVFDNGKGIKDEILDEIFTPFFSTKEKGSGIGLSLSRQIMRLHKGSISVKSKSGLTVFTLCF